MPSSRSPTSSAGRRGRNVTRDEKSETGRGSTPRDRSRKEGKGTGDRSRSGSAAPKSAFEQMASDYHQENREAYKRDGDSSAGGWGSAGEKRPAPTTATLHVGDWVCMRDQCYNHMYADKKYCGRHHDVGPGHSEEAVVVTRENREELTRLVTERREKIARRRSDKGKGRSSQAAGSDAGRSSSSWRSGGSNWSKSGTGSYTK